MISSTKKMTAIYIAVIFFVIFDRFLKNLALAGSSQPLDLIGQILKFNFKANYYIAFSLPLAGRLLAFLIGLIIITLILTAVYSFRRREDDRFSALLLIILGAASNLFDRIRFGYVVDYLDLKYFTVFNLADAMIVAGVFLLIIALNKKRAV